jgi:hypothetical protein
MWRTYKMSRPKPTVLLEHVNKTNYKSDQILNSEGIWAVFYDGQPINLKTQNMLVAYPGPKYKKVSFSNPGHAINLAKKLNTLFKIDKFSVVLLKAGDQIYP